MADNPRNTAQIGRAGFGKPGYCALCSKEVENPDLAEQIAERVKFKWSANQMLDWLAKQPAVAHRYNNRTWAKHKKHILDPADRVVTTVQVRQQQGLIPRISSGEEFTRSVLSAAMQRIVDHPEEVTIDHGLRAAQIEATTKVRESSVLNAIVLLVSQAPVVPQLREPAIEGEFTEET